MELAIRGTMMRSGTSLLLMAGMLAGCGGSTATQGPNLDAAADAMQCPDGGSPIEFCSNGHIQSSCCPAGAHCLPPASYCDLGGGACLLGACPADAGTDAPAPECVVNSDCHKSLPDMCNICKDMSLVCHAGKCMCACQVGD